MTSTRPRKRAAKDPHAELFLAWEAWIKTGKYNFERLPDYPYTESLGLPFLHERGVLVIPETLGMTFAEQAEIALTGELSEPLKKAFQTFGLDPMQPLAWRLLLYIFADAHFGSHPSKRGRSKKWTSERWCDLLSDLNQLQTRHPKKSEEWLCDCLKKEPQFKARYEGVSAKTIRRNLAYARDPQRNEILEHISDRYALREIKKAGKLTSAEETKIRRRAFEDALDSISTTWQRCAINTR